MTENNLFHAFLSRQRKLHQFLLCMPMTAKPAANLIAKVRFISPSESLPPPHTLTRGEADRELGSAAEVGADAGRWFGAAQVALHELREQRGRMQEGPLHPQMSASRLKFLKTKTNHPSKLLQHFWISGEGQIAAASTFTLFPKMSTLQLKLNNIIHMQMALLHYSQFIWLQFSCLSGGRSEILVARASTATHFTAQVFISSVLSRWDALCALNKAPAQARCWMQPSKSAGSSQLHQGQLQVWQELRVVTPQNNTSISAPQT